MWWVKLIAIALLIAAVVALARALMSLVRGEDKEGGKTMHALAWRVGLSVVVFLFILLSIRMGWVKPHDVNPTMHDGQPTQQQPASAPTS